MDVEPPCPLAACRQRALRSTMVRRSVFPMVHAARRLPRQVELGRKSGGLGHDLNLLLAWCEARFAAELWFWPGPDGAWCFAAKPLSEAFAAEAARLLGQPARIRVSRAVQAPAWGKGR